MKQILFVLSIALSVPAFAQETPPAAYYQVSSVTVKEVVPTAEEIASGYLLVAPQLQMGVLEDIGQMDWNALWLLGQKVIEVLKAGAPVFNMKRDAVAVVPKGLTDWQQLAGWQAPVTKAYEMKISNGLGMDVVDLRLKVSAMHGGNLNGRGQYLANVMVVPTATRVLWGWSVDLWTENRDPVNTGSLEMPTAGLGFEIRYKATTLFNEINGAQDYFVTGDGQLQQL